MIYLKISIRSITILQDGNNHEVIEEYDNVK